MKIISIISPFFYNHIVPFIKNNWQLIVIIFLIILFIFSDNSNKKLIKEYEKQIKESEKLVKNYRKDIKIIDEKIDSLNIIIKKLENDEVEIVDKIKDVDKLRDEKNKKIDKIQNQDSLIMLYPFRDNGERKPKIK